MGNGERMSAETTDITDELSAALDAGESWADETDDQILGDATDQAPPPAETFADRIRQYAAMNDKMIDAIFDDVDDLAALPRSHAARLWSFLAEPEQNVSETIRLELRKAIADAKKRKTNKPEEKVSERIRRDLAKWGYDLWLNDMDDSVWSGKSLLTDAQRAELRMKARDDSYAEKKLLSALDDAILAIAAGKRRHPLREYLAGLTWDGGDHIAHLASFVTDAHDPIDYGDGTTKRVFHAFLYRWLIGSIARIHGDANAARANFVLVLAALQGIGKSHLAAKLCTLLEFFVERHVNPDDKDTSLLRARAWVWEIGELGATTKRADVEALKQHITATTVTERKAYGHFDTVKPAIASYIGTVNPDGAGFLTDSTGNRRFAVVEIKSIDWAYADQVDMAQVWAQAYAAWMETPTDYRLLEVEKAKQEINAAAHVEADAFGDMLAQTFNFGGDAVLSSTDILKYLRKYAGLGNGSERQQGRDLARALHRYWGMEAKRSHGATKYAGIMLNEQWTAIEYSDK